MLLKRYLMQALVSGRPICAGLSCGGKCQRFAGPGFGQSVIISKTKIEFDGESKVGGGVTKIEGPLWTEGFALFVAQVS